MDLLWTLDQNVLSSHRLEVWLGVRLQESPQALGHSFCGNQRVIPGWWLHCLASRL